MKNKIHPLEPARMDTPVGAGVRHAKRKDAPPAEAFGVGVAAEPGRRGALKNQ